MLLFQLILPGMLYQVSAFGSGETNPEKIVLVEKILNDVGRVRDVVQGPDGFIYFSTSNRDGRGKAKEGDDHIYRIVPVY